ncbi:hypothetical protein Q7P37_006146 [Cladosporium fusiforme]
MSEQAPIVRASGEGVLVISCVDPRVPVEKILGFDGKTDPPVVRNAGGRVLDAIRTIGVMQSIIEPRYIVVIHHTAEVRREDSSPLLDHHKASMMSHATAIGIVLVHTLMAPTRMIDKTIADTLHADCGMTNFSKPAICETLSKTSPSAKAEFEAMEFGEITGSIKDSVREDIAALRRSPFVRQGTQLIGMNYDVDTGKLTVVE